MDMVIIMAEDIFEKNNDIVFSFNKVVNQRTLGTVHEHDNYELYYLIKGKTKYFIGDEIFEITKNQFAFIPKGVLHKTDSEECMHNERWLVNFTDNIFDDSNRFILNLLINERIILIKEDKIPKIEGLIHAIDTEEKKADCFSQSLIKMYTIELLSLLLRYKKSRKENPSISDKLIDNVSEFIRFNYDKPLTLDVLEKKFFVSKSHLCRKFKEVTGIGLNEYITYVRIMNSERLLKESRINITEIAMKCGFNDSNYFSTVFKKLKGITPYKYAKFAKEKIGE